MSSTLTIFGRASDEVLQFATVVTTSPAPLTSYSEATLITRNPAARVLFGAATVTLHFEIPAPLEVQLLAIPLWNVDPGSGVAVLTSGAGLNVAIPVPALPANRIPRTTVLDLTLLASAGQRTSDTFEIVITGNSVDVVMGGAVLLYAPLRQLVDRDFQWGSARRTQARGVAQMNEYGTSFLQSYETVTRAIDFVSRSTDADVAELEAFYEGIAGPYRPGILWPDPSINDAYFGTWDGAFTTRPVAPLAGGEIFSETSGTFTELGKGKPV